MRKILHHGSNRIEILDRNDTVLEFRDIAAALQFLRRFKSDPSQMAILRTLVPSTVWDVHRLTEEELLNQIAAELVSRRLRILRSVPRRGATGGEEEGEGEGQGETATQAAAKTAAPKDWIEIYLRDARGQPVQGERYTIKLPDGSNQEGNLDSFGHAEYYEINPGMCEVSFPDLEDEDWDLA